MAAAVAVAAAAGVVSGEIPGIGERLPIFNDGGGGGGGMGGGGGGGGGCASIAAAKNITSSAKKRIRLFCICSRGCFGILSNETKLFKHYLRIAPSLRSNVNSLDLTPSFRFWLRDRDRASG